MSKKGKSGKLGEYPKAQEAPEVELVPDAWSKFGKFIRDVAKAGPQHRRGKPTQSPKSRRGQATKVN